MVIVADTSPINYLILIETIDALPRLYGRVVVPPEVLDELRNASGPAVVRAWAATLPAWMQVQSALSIDATLPLGDGERAAIALAQELKADRLLIDERDGREIATRLGVP